jgi:hypothetical protein
MEQFSSNRCNYSNKDSNWSWGMYKSLRIGRIFVEANEEMQEGKEE